MSGPRDPLADDHFAQVASMFMGWSQARRDAVEEFLASDPTPVERRAFAEELRRETDELRAILEGEDR